MDYKSPLTISPPTFWPKNGEKGGALCIRPLPPFSFLHKILPENGIKVIEYERISARENTDDKNYISASKIREAIKQDTLNDVLNALPECTKKFLLSEDSASIREKIKQANGRH